MKEKAGYILLPRIIFDDPRLTRNDKWCWQVIHSFMNWGSGLCCPSLKTICKVSGMTLKTVNKSRDRLKELNYLKWQIVRTKKGVLCHYILCENAFSSELWEKLRTFGVTND